MSFSCVFFPRRRIRTPLVKMSVLARLLHRHCVTHKHSLCSPHSRSCAALPETCRRTGAPQPPGSRPIVVDSNLSKVAGRDPIFSGVGGALEKRGDREMKVRLWERRGRGSGCGTTRASVRAAPLESTFY